MWRYVRVLGWYIDRQGRKVIVRLFRNRRALLHFRFERLHRAQQQHWNWRMTRMRIWPFRIINKQNGMKVTYWYN